jgi:hypothetical protein
MELRTDDTKNIAYIRLTGALNREIILEAFDAAVADERYRKGMARLWDFRDADLSAFDTATIAGMATYSLNFPPGINDVKVAFVASRPLEFGLSRVFQAHAEESKTTISVFYSMEEAEAWLSE